MKLNIRQHGRYDVQQILPTLGMNSIIMVMPVGRAISKHNIEIIINNKQSLTNHNMG